MVVLSEVPIFALALGRVAGVSWPGVLARIHGDFGIWLRKMAIWWWFNDL